MLRFIRRLFVLLILFIIVFLIYRYVNPVGASMFVEKMKSIPDQISDFIGSNDDVKIEGTTVTITGDVDVLIKDEIDDGNNTGDNDMDDGDLTWLEELNEEINDILSKGDGTGENITEIEDNIVSDGALSGNNEDTVITGDNMGSSGNIDNGDITHTGSVVIELTDTDYKQMEDVFGNLVE